LKIVFGHNSAADFPILVKFCTGKHGDKGHTSHFENSKWRTADIFKIGKSVNRNEQIAQLSQRGRAMLRDCFVSWNSTKRRAQSFIVSYVGYILNHCVQLNAVLLSLA